VVHAMAAVCAPGRDNMVQALRSSARWYDDTRRALAYLMLDMSNYLINRDRRDLIEGAQILERKAFEVTVTYRGLDQTRKLFAPPIPFTSGSEAASFWNAAFVRLIEDDEPQVCLPETFEQQAVEIYDLRSWANHLIYVTALSLHVCVSWDARTVFYNSMLNAYGDGKQEEVLERFAASDSEAKRLVEMVKNPLDPTTKLLRRRLFDELRKSFASNNPSSLLPSIGVTMADPYVSRYIQQATKLAKINRDLYAPWYTEILMASE